MKKPLPKHSHWLVIHEIEYQDDGVSIHHSLKDAVTDFLDICQDYVNTGYKGFKKGKALRDKTWDFGQNCIVSLRKE